MAWNDLFKYITFYYSEQKRIHQKLILKPPHRWAKRVWKLCACTRLNDDRYSTMDRVVSTKQTE